MNERNRVEVDESYDGISPLGSGRDGYVTYTETEDYLVDLIRGFIIQEKGLNSYNSYLDLPGYPRLTVHNCWSGYSEYTITSTWHEITVEWGIYGVHFASAPEFFKALAGAQSDRDGF